jgi:hypothetical protein
MRTGKVVPVGCESTRRPTVAHRLVRIFAQPAIVRSGGQASARLHLTEKARISREPASPRCCASPD